MNRSITCCAVAVLWAGSLSAQQDPVSRLSEVLPADVAARVLQHVEAARTRALPVQAMANVALEGVAKGRSADEVLAAVEALAGEMGRAHEALIAAGHAPAPGEVEAAATAMKMGVSSEAVSELARSQPAGRTLTVPLLVLGDLAGRGLPSDEALAAVAARMAARADDAGLIDDVPGRGAGPGMFPGAAGPAGSPPHGGHVPAAGAGVPVGPPGHAGGRPGNVPTPPGRGGGPGDGPIG